MKRPVSQTQVSLRKRGPGWRRGRMQSNKMRLLKYPFDCVLCPVQSLSRVQLFATPWTVAHQAPLSMGFPRQEYRSVLPCLPPGSIWLAQE